MRVDLSGNIVIKTQPAKISLDSKKPEVALQKKEEEIHLEKELGQLEIKQKSAKLSVDAYPYYYDMGFYEYKDFTEDMVNKGRKKSLKAIAHYAKTGDLLMDFQKHDVAKIAVRDAYPETPEIGLKYVRGPKCEISKEKLKIKYKPGNVEVKSDSLNAYQGVNINYKKGFVNVALVKKQQIDIAQRGKIIDKQV